VRRRRPEYSDKKISDFVVKKFYMAARREGNREINTPDLKKKNSFA